MEKKEKLFWLIMAILILVVFFMAFRKNNTKLDLNPYLEPTVENVDKYKELMNTTCENEEGIPVPCKG